MKASTRAISSSPLTWSTAVALASSRFARRLKLPNVNLAFTAGLLHDIGKVVISEYVAEEYVEIIRLVTDDEMAFQEAERQVLGIDHTEIGAAIAEKWKLPDEMVHCIRYHHAPGEIEPPNLFVDVVYLANCICLLLGIGLGSDGLSYRADESVIERHGLTEHDLEEVGVGMLCDLQDVSDMFDEKTPDDNSGPVKVGPQAGGP